MIFNRPISDIIQTRTSVRTYSSEPISEDLIAKLSEFMDTLTNPFDIEVKFQLLTAKDPSIMLGTYGVITGADHFIGASIADKPFALEALGYEFETLILYLASLGLGTCWLGGTFDRSRFSDAMGIPENELFPAISPFGFPSEKKSIADKTVRRLSKGDSRKPWNELFFNQEFESPLTPQESKDFGSPLEMLRLSPSASNKQPWRVVKDHDSYHFYEAMTPGYGQAFRYDIQRIDIGIAFSHFDLTASEMGLQGKIIILKDPVNQVPAHCVYRFSWIKS